MIFWGTTWILLVCPRVFAIGVILYVDCYVDVTEVFVLAIDTLALHLL